MKQAQLTDFDVIIVGGGMVGLSMALLLTRLAQQTKSFSLALIEGDTSISNTETDQQTDRVNSFNPRVSALTIASQSLFDSLGLWQEKIAQRACPYENMYVWDAEGTGNISFSALDIHQEVLGHIVENNIVSDALREALQEESAIRVLSASQVSSYRRQGEYQRLSLTDGTELQAKLLIAADGANSFIRQEAGFEVKAWSYEQQAIVSTVQTEKSHEYTASQCFLSSGPLAFLPLLNRENNEQCYSSIVWSCDPEQAQAFMALEEPDFNRALQAAFEHKYGSVIASGKRFCFPLWQRHATSYVQSGLALIGDAAHTIHPLAGQGVNLGLSDAQCLAEVLGRALDKGEDFSTEQVLSRYQRQRKVHNLGMMALMEAFKRGFASDDLMMRWLRNTGMDLVDSTAPVKQQLMKRAMGL